MSKFYKSIIVMGILGLIMTVSSAQAVVVNFGHDRYLICLNNSESMTVFRNPDMADSFADIAAKRALQQIGMSRALTGKAAQTGVYSGLRFMYAAHFRERARVHQGGSFCIHYQCNVPLIRFLLHDLTRVTEALSLSSAAFSGQISQAIVAGITEILNRFMNSQVIQ